MTNDIQKADFWKRISAYLFDLIMFFIVTVGVAWLLTAALQFDSHIAAKNAAYEQMEAVYGEALAEMTYDDLSEEMKVVYGEWSKENAQLFNLFLLTVVFSPLLAYLLLEFFVPLKLGHGRTLGKKIFGIGIMRVDGVKVSGVQLFVRTVLGKYTVGTMIPVMLVILFFSQIMPLACLFGIALIFLLQLCFLFTTRHRTLIHDMMAATVAVDYFSQRIFESEEEKLAYEKRVHAEMAANAEYR